MDDTYLGGKCGRGTGGKTPFVAAVQTNDEGHPQRIKFSVVDDFRKRDIARCAGQHLAAGTHVVSEGIKCFGAVREAGCAYETAISGGGRAAVDKPEFYWVNTVLGNLKTALRSSYHFFDPKYAPRYLVDFEYRFNRRYRLPNLIPRLVYVALRTPPMPEKLLKHGL